ncbi:hypothetical protein FACS189472_02390 [Alphaproteobacteria bacterium]|nr:hypothetical protein FACS189472_02390 [Alphaproteobacteria bacterium]
MKKIIGICCFVLSVAGLEGIQRAQVASFWNNASVIDALCSVAENPNPLASEKQIKYLSVGESHGCQADCAHLTTPEYNRGELHYITSRFAHALVVDGILVISALPSYLPTLVNTLNKDPFLASRDLKVQWTKPVAFVDDRMGTYGEVHAFIRLRTVPADTAGSDSETTPKHAPATTGVS